MGLIKHALDWMESRKEFSFEILRIYLGIQLFTKGILFITNTTLVASLLPDGQMSLYSPLIAHYVAMAHLVGGFFLAVGLLTRLALIIQLPVLIGAVSVLFLNGGVGVGNASIEYTLLVLILLVVLIVVGPGELSVDRYLLNLKDED